MVIEMAMGYYLNGFLLNFYNLTYIFLTNTVKYYAAICYM
jgi:hypothetical protein